MSPYEKARHVYETEPCARTFDEDLRLHLAHGVVISRPDFFVMARPVSTLATPAKIVDPHFQFHAPDAWHVYLAAGNIPRAWEYLPFHLPWISFERRNVLRFYSLDRLKRIHCGP